MNRKRLTYWIAVATLGGMGRMTTYKGEWTKRLFRIDPETRAFLEVTASKNRFSLESVARLALRRYLERRKLVLDDWEALQPTRLVQFQTHRVLEEIDRGRMDPDTITSSDAPRVYLRVRSSWLETMAKAYEGEVNSLAAVVREAIREMCDSNPEEVKLAFAAEAEASRQAAA